LVFGFLNAFLVHNFEQKEQAGETDGVFLEMKPEGVILEMADSRDIVEYNL